MKFLCNLCLLLVALKLFGVIDWSWLTVFMPVWLPWLLLFALALVGSCRTSKSGKAKEDKARKHPYFEDR
ncbi:MAG: hypothetical protein FWH15_06275 [Betaproteobacteria bacterium]|nr:hypothetical protein [Betaproteobacteria bacterium]